MSVIFTDANNYKNPRDLIDLIKFMNLKVPPELTFSEKKILENIAGGITEIPQNEEPVLIELYNKLIVYTTGHHLKALDRFFAEPFDKEHQKYYDEFKTLIQNLDSTALLYYITTPIPLLFKSPLVNDLQKQLIGDPTQAIKELYEKLSPDDLKNYNNYNCEEPESYMVIQMDS